MTCFFLSDGESRGSLKVSGQLADALVACGVHCVMVTPDGRAPDWFHSSVAFAAEGPALSRVSAADTVVCSASRDVERMAQLSARLVFHAQGTPGRLGQVIADPSITVLTCWPATAASYRQQTGRDPIEVGIAVDDVFFHTAVRRVAGTVAFVPHQSADRASRWGASLPQLSLVPLDVDDDRRASVLLQASEFYLAPKGDGGCDVEILEALAAGCIVVGADGAGRALELLDGRTCIMANEHELSAVLREWVAPTAQIRRAAVRDRGRALAAPHRRAALRRRVASLVAGPLAFMRS